MKIGCSKVMFGNDNYNVYSESYTMVKFDTDISISIITARIRRMGKVIASLCLSVHTPEGTYLGQVQTGGYLLWLGGGGVPTLARSRWGRGTYLG